MGQKLEICLEACPPADRLAAVWRRLEARAQGSFFLSWQWISASIAASGLPDQLAVVRRDGEVAALGLLNRTRPANPLRSPSLWLHETGDRVRDGVAVEYNGLLADGWMAEAFLAAMRDRRDWCELHLGGVSRDWIEAAYRQGLGVRVVRRAGAPFANLSDAPEDLTERLSRNSRQHIRRAFKLYGEGGGVQVQAARDASEGADFLAALEALHTPYWQGRGKPGAFANPLFRPLHDHLVANGIGQGGVDLLRIHAGRRTIGYLYNFRHQGNVYAYQSGFAYEDDARLKPGLVSHVAAMAMYRSQGMRCYRFLAGDSRYKASLATGRDELVWLVLDRGDLAHRLERAVRRRLESR